MTDTVSNPFSGYWLRLKRFAASDFKVIGWVYVLVILGSTATQYFPPEKLFNGHTVTSYNNYVIFKQSFYHLLDGVNLYIAYPDEYWDLFKYTPTFALLFGMFAWMPDGFGLLLWNTLNVGLFYFAFRRLPFLSDSAKIAGLWLMIPEMVTATQNSQSNALMAALILLCFLFMESGKLWKAAGCIAGGFFVKLFALVGGALFLLYRGKIKVGLSLAIWFVVLTALPLIVVTLPDLQQQYINFKELLAMDANASTGLGVAGMLTSWFNINISKNVLLGAGVVIFMIPFARTKIYGNPDFKLLVLSSVLLWSVIFNHRAESPTFIIALAGVSIWYFMKSRHTVDHILLVLVFIFTCLSPTDIFPTYLYRNWVLPYALKGAFCVFVWIRIQVEMLTMEPVIGGSVDR